MLLLTWFQGAQAIGEEGDGSGGGTMEPSTVSWRLGRSQR